MTAVSVPTDVFQRMVAALHGAVEAFGVMNLMPSEVAIACEAALVEATLVSGLAEPRVAPERPVIRVGMRVRGCPRQAWTPSPPPGIAAAVLPYPPVVVGRVVLVQRLDVVVETDSGWRYVVPLAGLEVVG